MFFGVFFILHFQVIVRGCIIGIVQKVSVDDYSNTYVGNRKSRYLTSTHIVSQPLLFSSILYILRIL